MREHTERDLTNLSDLDSSTAAGKASRTGRLQRKASGGARASADEAVASVAGSTGQALPDGVRGGFEASLGTDLGGVRVHTGADSAAAAADLGARAFTTGQDIHFGAGEYRPDDPFGVHLLGHEVAHTVQQGSGGGGAQTKLEVSEPGDALEVEADRAADAMTRGEPAQVTASAPMAARMVHRFWPRRGRHRHRRRHRAGRPRRRRTGPGQRSPSDVARRLARRRRRGAAAAPGHHRRRRLWPGDPRRGGRVPVEPWPHP
jgi:hypothetical protein